MLIYKNKAKILISVYVFYIFLLKFIFLGARRVLFLFQRVCIRIRLSQRKNFPNIFAIIFFCYTE